jgi:DNA-binding beta-propeller fold protein YncE
MRVPNSICYLATLFLLAADTPSSSLQVTAGTSFDVDLYGNLFVLDAERNTLKLVSKDGGAVREVGGSGWQDGQFDRPACVWARNGIDVFVADYGNHRIERFDRKLNFVSSLSTRDSDNPDERFGYPTGVALSRFGNLFICDSENSRVVKVNGFSQVERTFGGFGAGKGRLVHPTRLEIGPKDEVFVLDGDRVVMFDNFGNYVGTLAEGAFKKPSAIFADQQSFAVLDQGILYCFDGEIRPTAKISLAEAGIPGEDARDFRFAGGRLYVLGPAGVTTVADPRGEGRLDKNENSR